MNIHEATLRELGQEPMRAPRMQGQTVRPFTLEDLGAISEAIDFRITYAPIEPLRDMQIEALEAAQRKIAERRAVLERRQKR